METSVILFFSGVGMFITLLLGGVIGWQYHEAVAKHTYKRQLDNLHPEFLDGNGSYVNEELLASDFQIQMTWLTMTTKYDTIVKK